MREYKFRGKRIDNGEWVIGSFTHVHDTDKRPTIIPFGANYFVSVDPDTVGQYTGLKDRNGKEVYEGDILQGKCSIGEVEWVQEHAGYRVFARDPSIYHALESDGQLKNTEVIGNIHDHPHLLQEQGEKE